MEVATKPAQNEVTTVICRKIRPGHEKDYKDWVRRYLTLVRRINQLEDKKRQIYPIFNLFTQLIHVSGDS